MFNWLRKIFTRRQTPNFMFAILKVKTSGLIKIGDVVSLQDDGTYAAMDIAKEKPVFMAPVEILRGDEVTFSPINGKVMSVVREGKIMYQGSLVGGVFGDDTTS